MSVNTLNDKMKKQELQQIIREEIDKLSFKGQLNTQAFKELGVQNVSYVQTILSKMKTGAPLSPKDNMILADVFLKMLANNNPALLQTIFTNIKQMTAANK